jgi:hypothetical protein|tara:strand:+ start:18406 stop:18882 length:477 start_codon:yes stop_codon:yes gene_type:complete
MNFKAIKGLIGAVAPTLGTALAGPLGGTAASAIASVLGCKSDAKSIETAMQSATPEQLVEIKKAELDFEKKMAELEVDVFALEAQDVKDARQAHKGDWTPRVVALVALVGFVGYIFLVTIQPPDANSDTIVSLILGYMGGVVSAITSFYFGASHKPDE